MQREVIWQAEGGIGQEHLTLSDRQGVIVADSFAIVKPGPTPLRVRYQVVLDEHWVVRGVAITTEIAHGSPTVIELRSDGKGNWTNSDGSPLPQLDGCIDIDISSTPFTNTLPIRRLDLREGQSEMVHAVYVNVETLRIEAWEQRYTRVDAGTVRYESATSGFQRDLDVDEDGLVRNYPGLFTRVWSG
ncbi:MAG TPA: putative glycolipid-binding domain-containing protein [Thermomicrobiales bacterium]|nr:putative glycolipid-binding domain-containing protein [Thermomicrobiales bacterium]